MKNVEFHPLADLVPLMGGSEFVGLVADIEANGLREPIVLYEGKILDGRARYRACQEIELEPDFLEWDGEGSPNAFVTSQNQHRRHLNENMEMQSRATAVCYLGRPGRFNDGVGKSRNEPLTGQVLCYYGDDLDAFKTLCGSMGKVVPTKKTRR